MDFGSFQWNKAVLVEVYQELFWNKEGTAETSLR